MSELFDKHGGFRKLHSFTLATIVQLETLPKSSSSTAANCHGPSIQRKPVR
jgi:hypothetical protein